MRASDVMTTNVITVAPDTSIQDLAALLSVRGISGVPVVDSGNKLLGIVSEGDLLHRAETGTERRTTRTRPRWFDFFGKEREAARDYVKSHSHCVRDVMTRDVITVDETAGLGDIANLLEANRIKRVPVVRDGTVVGIVSRSNLVRALVTAPVQTAPQVDDDDRAIRRRLLTELQDQPWARIWPADIIVRDRIVHLWSSDDRSEEERAGLRVAAENTPGVRGVQEHVVSVPMLPLL